jgi:hypothetical protein
VVPDRVSARRLDRGGLRAKRSSRGRELVDERSLSPAAALRGSVAGARIE